MRRHFRAFRFLNEPRVPERRALLLAPNHFSWWDGFFAYQLWRIRFPERRFHLMMLAERLRRYWVFRRLGCYGVSRGAPRSVAAARAYTRAVLADSSNLSVFYPQGEIQPAASEAVSLERGLPTFLPEGDAATALPVAFGVSWSEEKLPWIDVRFGEPLASEDVRRDFDRFRQAFMENLRALERERRAPGTTTRKEPFV
jgi:1-acyl-sn-glycerol-3-phosphate acyltransferase